LLRTRLRVIRVRLRRCGTRFAAAEFFIARVDPAPEGLEGALAIFFGRLVAGEGGVDGAGPGVDASGEGLDVLEALVAEPHGNAERTCPVVAEDDYLLIWVEFRVGAGGDLAHGHEQRVGEGGGLVLPGLAYV